MQAILNTVLKLLAGPLASVGGWLVNVLIGKVIKAIYDYIQKKKWEKERADALLRYKQAQTEQEKVHALEDLVRISNKQPG